MSWALLGALLAVVAVGAWRLRRPGAPPPTTGPTADPLLGRTVAGYRLMQKLGDGGMASVYRATPAAGGLPVALKVLPAELSADPTFQRRFEREATVGMELQHPSLVRVLQWGRDGDNLFLVMELVPGQTLRERIKAGLGVDDAVSHLRAMLEAMRYAHERGCVHRDLKPANVIVSGGGRLKIVDFGLVRRDDFATLTRTGQMLGTVGYVAPEQMEGAPGDERSDQHALGVIAYEMLTGRNPYRGNLTALVSGKAVPPAREVRPEVPVVVSDAVARMMASDPADRFPDLATALHALEAT